MNQPGGEAGYPDGFFDTPGPKAAALLGDVGLTTVAGTATSSNKQLPVGENIYGPFEAGFTQAQDNVLATFGCETGRGYLAGGIDTYTAEQMVAADCGVTLPRTDTSGAYISLLDSCGGHTNEYHFHERLKCLYSETGTHSTQVGRGSDGRAIYGKWEDFSATQKPLLDACGGHWGSTPDFPDKKTYHYHVQDTAPFTIGCFGPNADNSPVTVAQCRALYDGNDGCGGGDTTTLVTAQGNKTYDPWCPCYDATGANVGTITPLPIFAGQDASGPGQTYEEPAGAVDRTTNFSTSSDGGLPSLLSAIVTVLAHLVYGVCR
jgi:hypothetical protein